MIIRAQHPGFTATAARQAGLPAPAAETPAREPFEQVSCNFNPPPQKPKPGLVQALIREASFLARSVALWAASIPSTLFGVGLGASPHRVSGAKELHDLGITGKGVRVAIMDQAFTKFGAGDEDIKGVYDANTGQFSTELKEAGTDPVAQHATGQKHDSFHGNSMASIITGESWGVKGVAPDAEIIGVKVLDKNRTLTPKVFVDGLQWLVDNHRQQNIKAVSISLNYRNISPTEQQQAQALISQLHQEGVTIVAAAGNRGPKPDTVYFPGNARDVICVGSYTQGLIPGPYDDRIERHSSRGGSQPGPHLVGPGGSVFSKNADGLVELTSGTSNAVPMLVGGLCLLAEAYPQAGARQREQALLSTARPISGDPAAEGSGAFQLKAAYDLMAASQST